MVEISTKNYPQIVVRNPLKEAIDNIFYIEWDKKLLKNKIFEENDSKRIVNSENLTRVMRAIQIDKVLKPGEAFSILDHYEEFQAPFDLIRKDLTNMVTSIADEGYEKLIQTYNTPAEKIVKMLMNIKSQHAKFDKALEKEINYAISMINERSLYSAARLSTINLYQRHSNPQVISHQDLLGQNLVEFLREYSDFSIENFSSASAKNVRNRKRFTSEGDTSPDKLQKKYQSQDSIFKDYQNYEKDLVDTNTRAWDIFNFLSKTDRAKVLPLCTLNLIYQHHLDVYIQEDKFQRFLSKIYYGYMQQVQYHNDLHGVDVAQMGNIVLSQGGLIKLADLGWVDILSFLIGCVCHDYGHDGFNNGFHINAQTDRATRYNDISVQENYHAAESFELLKKEENNFIEQFSPDEKKVFRKRFIGCILATDMAKHAADLSTLKSIIEAKGIKGGQNADQIINQEDESTLFKSQQFILECAVHASDVSQGSRDFSVVKQWTYLLYDEFFDQGDVEKEKGLPISFLCNRETTNVPKMQPGFLNGISIPLWSALTEVMPPLHDIVDALKDNVQKWTNYEETEEDKQIYIKKS